MVPKADAPSGKAYSSEAAINRSGICSPSAVPQARTGGSGELFLQLVERLQVLASPWRQRLLRQTINVARTLG